MTHPAPDAAETVTASARLETEQAARIAAEASAARLSRELANVQRGMELLQTITIAANQATSIEDAMQIALDQVAAHTGWLLGHAYLQADR